VARTKTTEMSTITAAQLADGDWVPVVDVSDTTMSSTGTNKKLAKSQLAEAAGVTAHAAVTSSVHGISAFGATLVDDADAATARSTLGLGTIATQAAGSVAITGGSVTGITDLAVADGGTGGSTAAAALANLTSTTLAADGDILTRSGGAPAPITRANLAADEAFASRFAPLVGPVFSVPTGADSVDLDGTALTGGTTKPVLRVLRPNPPDASWATGTMISQNGAFYTNAWMIISGHMPGSADADGNYFPEAADPAKSTMLSIYSDVNSAAVEIRPASTTSGNRCLDILDTSKNVRLAIEYTGRLSWGASTYAAVDAYIERSAAGTVSVGAPGAHPKLTVAAETSKVAQFDLTVNGATCVRLASAGTDSAYWNQSTATVFRTYSTARLTVGADVSPATFTVAPDGTATVPVSRFRRGTSGSTQDTLQITNETTTVFHRFNYGGYSITKLNAAPADGDLSTGELAMWFDSTAGAAKAMFKGKNASGTVVTGSVTLS